jgi:hypothetical protein
MGTVIVFQSLAILFLSGICFNLYRDWKDAVRKRASDNEHWEAWNSQLAKDIADLEAENKVLQRDKQSLTQPVAKAQDAAKRPLRGAEIRRMAERVNAPAAEPTQAQRLENHG